MIYTATLISKKDILILKSDVNRFGGNIIKHNLCLWDVIKLRKLKFKNSFVSIDKQQARYEYIKTLKTIYPNYTFKQLRQIGFNI